MDAAIISSVISIIALSLSALSTFLTFFYNRTRLTGVVVRGDVSLQRSGGFDGEKASVSFQTFAKIGVLISNHGNRPVTLTSLALVVDDEEPNTGFQPVEPTLLAPNSAQVFTNEYRVSQVSLDDVARDTKIPARTERVWAQVRLHNHRGKSRVVKIPALELATTYIPGEGDERYPNADITATPAHRPTRLV